MYLALHRRISYSYVTLHRAKLATRWSDCDAKALPTFFPPGAIAFYRLSKVLGIAKAILCKHALAYALDAHTDIMAAPIEMQCAVIPIVAQYSMACKPVNSTNSNSFRQKYNIIIYLLKKRSGSVKTIIGVDHAIELLNADLSVLVN